MCLGVCFFVKCVDVFGGGGWEQKSGNFEGADSELAGPPTRKFEILRICLAVFSIVVLMEISPVLPYLVFTKNEEGELVCIFTHKNDYFIPKCVFGGYCCLNGKGKE